MKCIMLWIRVWYVCDIYSYLDSQIIFVWMCPHYRGEVSIWCHEIITVFSCKESIIREKFHNLFTIGFLKPGICADSWFLESNGTHHTVLSTISVILFVLSTKVWFVVKECDSCTSTCIEICILCFVHVCGGGKYIRIKNGKVQGKVDVRWGRRCVISQLRSMWDSKWRRCVISQLRSMWDSKWMCIIRGGTSVWTPTLVPVVYFLQRKEDETGTGGGLRYDLLLFIMKE